MIAAVWIVTITLSSESQEPSSSKDHTFLRSRFSSEDLADQPSYFDRSRRVAVRPSRMEKEVDDEMPRHIVIRTQFVEINPDTSEDLGFDWVITPFAKE